MINIREVNKKDKERIRRMMKGVRGSIKKDRERRIKVGDCCRKYKKEEREVFIEVTELIRSYNKELYDEMTNPDTPEWRRSQIWFTFFIEKYLMALA